MLLFIENTSGHKFVHLMQDKRHVKTLLKQRGEFIKDWRIWNKGWTDGSPNAWQVFTNTDCAATFAGVYYPD